VSNKAVPVTRALHFEWSPSARTSWQIDLRESIHQVGGLLDLTEGQRKPLLDRQRTTRTDVNSGAVA
jgi:hypothetical protein